jgi:peptidylprolyl isomerase
MQRISFLSLCAPLLGLALAACDRQATDTPAPAAAPAAATATPPVSGPIVPNLVALPGLEDTVPELTRVTRVRFETTAGDVMIQIYPDAAPNAAERFVELVQSGFYDSTPISRVVPEFVAQFGVNWRDEHRDWKDRLFDDDPTLFALERGTLAFAKAGANSNSTQVFINYTENNRLADPQYNFTVFGQVISGMEVVDEFVQVGDPGGGLDQNQLWSNGGAYLESLPIKPTMIERASIL